MVVIRSFADKRNGSAYIMEFSTAEEAAAYEAPDDRTEIENAPSPDHRWRDGAWKLIDQVKLEADARTAREAKADAEFAARAARLGYVKQSDINGLIDARIRPNKI